MAERSAYFIENECTVIHKQDIKIQLEQLGIQKGMLLIVNADTLHMGYLNGGCQAVIEALMECVGYEGTIVVPTFTPQYKDPACQKDKPPRQQWQEIRKQALPFDRKLSEPMGADPFVYQFLRNDAVLRSNHPLYSFAAWGKYAKLICDKHPLHFALGKDSPLGKIYEMNGYCILLGCEYEACTMFHMAEYQKDIFPVKLVSAPIESNHRILWKDLLDIEQHNENFSEIGEVMEDRKIVKTAYIANSKCHFFSAREAVNLASTYFHMYYDEI